MSLISSIAFVVNTTVKVAGIIEAGAQVKDVCDRMDGAQDKIPPTTAEKANAAFQGFFMIAQVASIGTSFLIMVMR